MNSRPASSTSQSAQDGPVTVNLGDVYRKGEVKIESCDLRVMPPLPAGYAALNNQAYRVTTTALASGPYIGHFNAASVKNEEVFKNLRILHAEPDPFDPDAIIWVDRTADSTNAEAPSFANRTLDSFSEELGIFVIARQAYKAQPASGVVDLAITAAPVAESVTASSSISLNLTVRNLGSEVATEVGLVDHFPADAELISAAPSQGVCKLRRGTVCCKLGTLPAGASAKIEIVATPYEEGRSFPSEGQEIFYDARVLGQESESDFKNNVARGMVRVFSNPNRPPTITITSPIRGPEGYAMIVGPSTVTIQATASDSDGFIKKVELYDNGQLAGTGETLDGSHFTITERDVQYGHHVFQTIATDNGGRASRPSATEVFVNGTASLSIALPEDGAVLSPDAPIVIDAKASHASGIITKVEFFEAGMSIGVGTIARGNHYTLRIDNPKRTIHRVTAVATDGSGIQTISAPITYKVTARPIITWLRPLNRQEFIANTTLDIGVRVAQPDGEIVRVDLYVNDRLIGSSSPFSHDEFGFTWKLPDAGVYSMTVIATNDLGVTAKSEPVKITIADKGRSLMSKFPYS